MKKPQQIKVGLFSFQKNNQIQALLNRINQLEPGACRTFDLSLDGAERLSMQSDQFAWDGVDVGRLQTAYVHSFTYQFPVLPQPLFNVDWSVWQTAHIADQQKFSFTMSLLQELERRGVTILNPLKSHIAAFMKYEQLDAVRRAGFAIPKMVCTNDMDDAVEFCKSSDNPVWRPATGRAMWQPFHDRQRNHLISPDKPPVLIAETKSGPLIRVFVLQGKPVLFLEHGSPGFHPLETLETVWHSDYPALHGSFKDLHEKLDTDYMQVTFVLSEETPWIYDVDVDPMFDWLPEVYQSYLIDRLALGLLNRMEESVVVPETEARQRPTLFVRRMLKILFDMEASKYRPVDS
jgi:hypothetical protein